MGSEKLRLSLVCILIYVVVAGFVTQIGLLTGPIASAYNKEVTSTTAIFSFLTGGFLAGTFAAYFLLDYIRIKSMVLGYGLLLIISVFGILFIENYSVLPIFLGIIGFVTGISTCIAGIVVGRLWEAKKRESFFIGLDAAYNLGGVFFPFVTTYVLLRQLPWTYCLLAVVVFVAIILYLSLQSGFYNINPDKNMPASQGKVEWNSGIIIAGVSLFLVIHGKYSIILWLPQYAQNVLALGPEEAGKLISSVFSTALIGSVAGIYIVAKIRIMYFICAALLTGTLSGLLFTFVGSYASAVLIAATFGLAVSVLYNVFVVYGLNFVSQPSHKHISFVIVSSGIAATIAPYSSSLIVKWFGSSVAGLYAGSLSYFLAFTVLLLHVNISPVLSARKQRVN